MLQQQAENKVEFDFSFSSYQQSGADEPMATCSECGPQHTKRDSQEDVSLLGAFFTGWLRKNGIKKPNQETVVERNSHPVDRNHRESEKGWFFLFVFAVELSTLYPYYFQMDGHFTVFAWVEFALLCRNRPLIHSLTRYSMYRVNDVLKYIVNNRLCDFEHYKENFRRSLRRSTCDASGCASHFVSKLLSGRALKCTAITLIMYINVLKEQSLLLFSHKWIVEMPTV